MLQALNEGTALDVGLSVFFAALSWEPALGTAQAVKLITCDLGNLE
jgi:hypothetical protein